MALRAVSNILLSVGLVLRHKTGSLVLFNGEKDNQCNSLNTAVGLPESSEKSKEQIVCHRLVSGDSEKCFLSSQYWLLFCSVVRGQCPGSSMETMTQYQVSADYSYQEDYSL